MTDTEPFNVRAHLFEFYMSEDLQTSVEHIKKVPRMVQVSKRSKKKNPDNHLLDPLRNTPSVPTASEDGASSKEKASFEVRMVNQTFRVNGPRYLTYTWVNPDTEDFVTEVVIHKRVPRSERDEQGNETIVYDSVPVRTRTSVHECMVLKLTIAAESDPCRIAKWSLTKEYVPASDIRNGLNGRWTKIGRLGYYRTMISKACDLMAMHNSA